MNHIIKVLAFIIIAAVMNSCGDKSDKTGSHNHEGPSSKTAHSDEETTSTIATLTPEQIAAVGISLGDIENKDLTATIKANGLLSVPNNNKANATSLYGGVVKTLNVQIGSYVRKGQVIATIANPQFIQVQEEYLTLASRIVFAEQEMNRQQELFTGNAGAEKNLQSATAELTSLRTRRASLQQQIQLMGIDPGKLSSANLQSLLMVTSPISGSVSNVFAKISSYVDVSSPVAEIVDNGSLHLDLNVFEKDLPLLKIGQVIHFTLTNNPSNEYDAEVFSIGAAFENDTKTIPVHCKVKGNKDGLIDGMNVTGIVSLSNITTPAVPNDAIVSADGKDYIFMVTEEEPGEHADHQDEKEEANSNTNFKKIEIAKGVSDMGYTAITPVTEIPKGSKIAVKGAFFINAKLGNTGGHEH